MFIFFFQTTLQQVKHRQLQHQERRLDLSHPLQVRLEEFESKHWSLFFAFDFICLARVSSFIIGPIDSLLHLDATCLIKQSFEAMCTSIPATLFCMHTMHDEVSGNIVIVGDRLR